MVGGRLHLGLFWYVYKYLKFPIVGIFSFISRPYSTLSCFIITSLMVFLCSSISSVQQKLGSFISLWCYSCISALLLWRLYCYNFFFLLSFLYFYKRSQKWSHKGRVTFLFCDSFQIIRVQSADGTKRVEVKPTDTTKTLYEKVHEVHELSSFEFSLYTSRDLKTEIVSSNRKTLKGYKLNHGDMLFLQKIGSEGEVMAF